MGMPGALKRCWSLSIISPQNHGSDKQNTLQKKSEARYCCYFTYKNPGNPVLQPSNSCLGDIPFKRARYLMILYNMLRHKPNLTML